MEQLATSSANAGAMNSVAQQQNEVQFTALYLEINNIVANTTYGNQPLLNGSYNNETFQIGFQSSNTINVSIPSLTFGGLGLTGLKVYNASLATVAITGIQNALQILSNASATVGASQDQLQAFVQDLQTMSTNVESANSSVVDVNMAQGMTQFTTDQILLQSGLSMLGQAQANPTLVLKLL